MSAWEDRGEPVEYATLGRGVLGRLTAWAQSYAGPCDHAGRQFARVGDLRSGCPGCTSALDGWNAPRPCDLCGGVTEPDLAWSLPAELTGGVHVFLAVCKTCSRRELHDPTESEEDTMSVARCCPDCRAAFTAYASAGDRLSAVQPSLHRLCREELLESLRAYGREETREPIRNRIAAVIAARALSSEAGR